jgi:hypothetical protein
VNPLMPEMRVWRRRVHSGVGRWNCHFSPTPPNPLAPPGAGEPNSRVWPTRLTDDVHAVKPVDGLVLSFVGAQPSGRKTPVNPIDAFDTNLLRPEGWAPTDGLVVTGFAKSREATGQTAGTSRLQSVGQIRLLAPLSARAGVERGGGDRGGNKLRSGKRVGDAQQLSWVGQSSTLGLGNSATKVA